jgi:hypothetical protein
MSFNIDFGSHQGVLFQRRHNDSLGSFNGITHDRLKGTAGISPGYLFAPNHFNAPNFNTLMSSVPRDPQARMPALKVMPVNVAREGVRREGDP